VVLLGPGLSPPVPPSDGPIEDNKQQFVTYTLFQFIFSLQQPQLIGNPKQQQRSRSQSISVINEFIEV